MKIWPRAVGASIAVVACYGLVGCSSGNDAGGSPSPEGTSPSGSPSSTTPGPNANRLKISDLPSDPQVIWREDVDFDRSATNQDLSLAPGTYEVRAVCTAPAALKISTNGGPLKDLACSTAYGPGLKVCATKAGLLLQLQRTSEPSVDLVWQLSKTNAGQCSPTPPPTVPAPTGTARG